MLLILSSNVKLKKLELKLSVRRSQQARKIKKNSRQKTPEIKLKKKFFFREFAFFDRFKLFSSKIDFWSFFKLQKMKYGQKNFREIDLFDFTRFFGLDFFKFTCICLIMILVFFK